MPHRGRLNLLTSILQFPPRALFHKIRGGWDIPEELEAAGDVISHLSELRLLSVLVTTIQLVCIAASPTLRYPSLQSDASIKISLLPNPSHLEAINPVALGKTRAKQFSLFKELSVAEHLEGCVPGDRVMCVQLHGDASFTGQGIIMEGLGLSWFTTMLRSSVD